MGIGLVIYLIIVAPIILFCICMLLWNLCGMLKCIYELFKQPTEKEINDYMEHIYGPSAAGKITILPAINKEEPIKYEPIDTRFDILDL